MFFVWFTLSEHKSVILAERRGLKAALRVLIEIDINCQPDPGDVELLKTFVPTRPNAEVAVLACEVIRQADQQSLRRRA